MASVIIGDYIYTTSDTGRLTASVEAEDKSKSSYGPIQSSVEINGVSYSVTSLHYCFDGCFSLTQAPEIPSSVIKMSSCFSNCAALTAAPEIPSGVTDMSSCFIACTSLTQAPVIPSSVTNMSACFYGCESLTQAPEIPSSALSMSYCFSSCTSLTGTIIVHNIPTSYSSIFTSVPSLEVITIGATDAVYNKWSEITYDYPDVIINDFLDSSVTFHDGDYTYISSIDYETIDNYHQNEDGDDSQVELEWDVAEDGEMTLCYHAPGDSTDHTVTFINNGTTQTVGPITFDGGLVFVAEEGYTIQWLEYDAINIPNYKLSAETIDKTKEVYSALSENFYINNVVYNLIYLNHCFNTCTSLTQAPEIPSGVTDMIYCFYGCTSLTQAPEIPSSVTNMSYCFSDCTSLTQAPEIPSSVTSMSGCFRDCTSLTQAPEIPSSVTSMNACFRGCIALTQAPEIPSGVTDMIYCFYVCTSLTQAPEIPSSVTNMSYCFSDCTSLTQAPEIPSSVGLMQFCFTNCTSLAQAPDIPSSVDNIQYCFAGCTSLIGNINVSATASIVDHAFDGTTHSIYLINNTQPKSAAVTANLRSIAADYSNVHFEDDDVTPPSTLLKVKRVDDDGDTESSIDGLWAYLNALTTVYITGFPDGWYIKSVTGGIMYIDSVDVTSSAHMVGPNLRPDAKYLTNTWYNINDLLQHSVNFGITFDIWNESGRVHSKTYTGTAVILSSSIPLVSYLAGGGGLAIGQTCTQEGFECNMPTTHHQTVDCEDTLTAPDMTQTEVDDFVDSLDISKKAVTHILKNGSKNSAQGESLDNFLDSRLNTLGGKNTGTVSLYNCSGTVSHNNLEFFVSEGGEIWAQGRININSYVRSGPNSGVMITLPDIVPTPTKNFWSMIGFQSQHPREYVYISLTPNSRAAYIQTSESFNNTTNGTLTFICSGRVFVK